MKEPHNLEGGSCLGAEVLKPRIVALEMSVLSMYLCS